MSAEAANHGGLRWPLAAAATRLSAYPGPLLAFAVLALEWGVQGWTELFWSDGFPGQRHRLVLVWWGGPGINPAPFQDSASGFGWSPAAAAVSGVVPVLSALYAAIAMAWLGWEAFSDRAGRARQLRRRSRLAPWLLLAGTIGCGSLFGAYLGGALNASPLLFLVIMLGGFTLMGAGLPAVLLWRVLAPRGAGVPPRLVWIALASAVAPMVADVPRTALYTVLQNAGLIDGLGIVSALVGAAGALVTVWLFVFAVRPAALHDALRRPGRALALVAMAIAVHAVAGLLLANLPDGFGMEEPASGGLSFGLRLFPWLLRAGIAWGGVLVCLGLIIALTNLEPPLPRPVREAGDAIDA